MNELCMPIFPPKLMRAWEINLQGIRLGTTRIGLGLAMQPGWRKVGGRRYAHRHTVAQADMPRIQRKHRYMLADIACAHYPWVHACFDR